MRFSKNLRKFFKQENGVAALEFALVAPMLLIAYLGFVQMARMDDMHSRVGDTGATINDIIAKLPQLNADQIDAAMDAGLAIAGDWASQMQVRVVGVTVDDEGNAKVLWARSKNMSKPGVDAPFTLPPALLTRSGFFVATTTAYDYTWNITRWHNTAAPSKMKYDYYHVPRSSAITDCTNC